MRIDYVVCDICNREITEVLNLPRVASLKLTNEVLRTSLLSDICNKCNKGLMDAVEKLESTGLGAREGFERRYY